MRKMTLLFAALACLTGIPLRAQDISGDWQGSLKAGVAEIRIVLHVSKASDGSLKATFDSPDQNATGMKVAPIALKDSKLSFTVSEVDGSYAGTVNSAGTAISGTWTQRLEFPLNFQRATSAIKTEHKAAAPSDIDGAWLGTLNTGVASLRLIFHIVNTEDGLMATMDSPDQGAKGIPVTAVNRNGPALSLEMKQLGGGFEGTISADLSAIEGKWTQGGGSLPLVLKRTKDASELERRRPQNPVKPYPYREEEVAYANSSAGIQLGATLTIPQGSGPFTAVLLITGSGQQDRDETLLGHKPFLVLADYLTRRGIAVLRVDDRGIGKSGGDFEKATTADFATDVEAGMAWLKTRAEVNPHKLGLIGHSEGGDIAAMVAARNPDVAFIVMMAGSGVRGDEILPAQVAAIAEAGGASREAAGEQAAREREILNLVEHGNMEDVPAAQREQLQSPWFRYFLEYDPASALAKVKCPVLAVIGEKDRQVPAEQNLPAIRKALTIGGNQHFEADELPGLNHLFQAAKTGSPAEYAEIEETISPLALEKIANWLAKQ